MSAYLAEERRGAITVLTLQRPDALNAISAELRKELIDTFQRLETAGAGVVVLTGSGRAFCAGLDLKELERDGLGAILQGPASGLKLAEAIESYPWPIIGGINGAAVAGGFELALACDVLIAAPEARFADTHGRVGVLPHWGMSQKLSRTIGLYRAKEVSLTGRFVSAEEAVAWGLVSRIVPAEQLLEECLRVGNQMLACSLDVLKRYKRLIDRGHALALGDALQLEHQEPYPR